MRHINETVEQAGGELRRETLNGEEFLVAPVVAIQEGVYLYPRANGRGIKRELLTAEEIQNSLPAWEGKPLTIPHPEDEDGRPGLIVNDATTHTEVGQFRNVGVEDEALIGETWIRANDVGTVGGKLEQYLNAIEEGEPQEVSTGYRADTNVAKGTYDNQRYTYEQVGLVPDHLALLPDERGNCSVAEGCGAGATVNQMPFAGEDGVRVNNRRATVNATPQQVDLARSVAEEFVASQGNATLEEFERYARENEQLGPGEQTAVMAVFDELFGQDPGEWGVESEFLPWLDQQAGDDGDRENTDASGEMDGATLGDISEPSGTLSVDEGLSGSDTGGGVLTEFFRRLNNLMAGEQPAGDSELGADDENTEKMQDNIDRETLIEEIVTNSDMKEKSVKELGDSCLQVAHERFVNEETTTEGGDGGAESTESPETTESPEEPAVDPSTIEELRETVEAQQETIDELQSEREAEREELEEQVNQRLIENTEISEENLDSMSLEAKQNLAQDLGATEEPEEQTVNMNGIADSGAATDFEMEGDDEAESIPAPGRANYDAFQNKESDN